MVAVKTHVAAPASTNSEGLTAKPTLEKSCLIFVRARDPSGLALVPCALSAVDKRGRKNMLGYTNIHTKTRKQRKSFKALYPRMRSDMKKKKRLSAARFAHKIPYASFCAGYFCRFYRAVSCSCGPCRVPLYTSKLFARQSEI